MKHLIANITWNSNLWKASITIFNDCFHGACSRLKAWASKTYNSAKMWTKDVLNFEVIIKDATLLEARTSLTGAGVLVLKYTPAAFIYGGPAGAAAQGTVGLFMVGSGLVIGSAGVGYDPFELFKESVPSPTSEDIMQQIRVDMSRQ